MLVRPIIEKITETCYHHYVRPVHPTAQTVTLQLNAATSKFLSLAKMKSVHLRCFTTSEYVETDDKGQVLKNVYLCMCVHRGLIKILYVKGGLQELVYKLSFCL